MQFTYDSYRNLIALLKKHGYHFADYETWQKYPRCVILRHDIDNDIAKAVELGKIERDLGVCSTFFVLLTSDFYNVFSDSNGKLLKSITDCGHQIGLHFDEVRYPEIKVPEDARDLILREAGLLEKAADVPINCVSMHRPSKMILEADLKIPGMINSYGQTFFKEFKYLSDSRRCWREPVEQVIASEKYERLHILTHAIWYNEKGISLHDSIFNFVNAGNRARYTSERENITDLNSIMSEDEVR